MATHTLELERRTLHGHFSRHLAPVLTIDPGDTVVFRTLNAGWSLEPPSDGEPPSAYVPRTPELDDGHALCGPIAVRGAEPGLTLSVRIGAIRPGSWGVTVAGGRPRPVNARFGIEDGEPRLHRWTLDPDALTARNQLGFAVRLRPFMGVMGMPPPEEGVHPTGPPRRWGGNMDCRELVSGSTLHLPVPVPLALFSVGDGHGAQADGEVSGTAIECPMERVELTFGLREDVRLGTAWAETPAGLVTMGFDHDLDEAMLVALDAMLLLMERRYGLDRRDAIALASVVVDLRVTQVVNGVQGVHAVLPPEPFLATP
jgi:acetamidase/formamidase